MAGGTVIVFFAVELTPRLYFGRSGKNGIHGFSLIFMDSHGFSSVFIVFQ